MNIQLVSVLAASVGSVRQVIKVRVLPTDSEAAALDATLNLQQRCFVVVGRDA